MTNNHLIGSFFFNDETVNGENYLSMPEPFFLPEVRRLRKVCSIILQQEDAPPHFARDAGQLLNKHFPDR